MRFLRISLAHASGYYGSPLDLFWFGCQVAPAISRRTIKSRWRARLIAGRTTRFQPTNRVRRSVSCYLGMHRLPIDSISFVRSCRAKPVRELESVAARHQTRSSIFPVLHGCVADVHPRSFLSGLAKFKCHAALGRSVTVQNYEGWFHRRDLPPNANY